MGKLSSDRLPWLLLPCILLTLGGVTILMPHQKAQSATLHQQGTPKPAVEAYDDGDGGDELLEHWDSPKYAAEERVQVMGAAVGFLLLGVIVWGKRASQPQPYVQLKLVDVSQPEQTKHNKAA